jgi:hypothetical protein
MADQNNDDRQSDQERQNEYMKGGKGRKDQIGG